MDSTCKKEELVKVGGKGFYRKRTGKGGVGVWRPGIGQKRGMGEHVHIRQWMGDWVELVQLLSYQCSLASS